MSDWLRSLPHKIPFRAAASAEVLDEKRVRGSRLISAGDAMTGMSAAPMLIEAMAQIAGVLAFRGSAVAGSLAGVERFEMSRLPADGDLVEIEAELVTDFGGIYRFEGKALIGEEIVATGRFYLGGGAAR